MLQSSSQSTSHLHSYSAQPLFASLACLCCAKLPTHGTCLTHQPSLHLVPSFFTLTLCSQWQSLLIPTLPSLISKTPWSLGSSMETADAPCALFFSAVCAGSSGLFLLFCTWNLGVRIHLNGCELVYGFSFECCNSPDTRGQHQSRSFNTRHYMSLISLKIYALGFSAFIWETQTIGRKEKFGLRETTLLQLPNHMSLNT